ncbi:hypothetical protein [Microbacterium sp. che218]|uniref:hypothetical protein n=1 Tax=Microbacterium sp. che218 TaxID=3140649 RepID=UPI003365B48E
MPTSLRSRIAVVAAATAAVAVLGGGVMMFGLMADEARFPRSDPAFDALGAHVASIPGVTDVQSERWVEAPLFVQPHASLSVTVSGDDLDEVWRLACSSEYPDAVSWGFDVVTVADTRVSFAGEADGGCPDVGFDPAPVVTEIGRLAPGENVQAAIWDDARLGISTIDGRETADRLLPLVAGADALRTAAGVDPGTPVEVSGPQLGVVVGPGEAQRYHDLLTRLIDTYGATALHLGGGGTPIDGIEKVQLAAPAEHHAAIEREIAASGLPIADLAVAFLS